MAIFPLRRQRKEFRRQYPDVSLLDEGFRIKFDRAE
jgi:hypothetical protein